MPATWDISLSIQKNEGAILGWNLESPQPGADPAVAGEVRFKGWLLSEGGTPGQITLSQGGSVLAECAADLARPDVVRARMAAKPDTPVKERCGFDITVPRRLGIYRLRAQAGKALMEMDILDTTGGPFALVGENRHLFLGGDSNDSIGQFTQNRPLPESSILAWGENFAAMRRWEAEFDLRCAFLVAPSKEEVFAEFYPYPRVKRTVLDEFRTRFSDAGAIAPVWELRAQRNFAYSETDTHWTDQGATIAARAVLKAWGMEVGAKSLPTEFRVHQRQGDLGIKLEPRRASWELVFADPPDVRKVFDNGVQNNGCLRLWRNPDAPRTGCCLVLGDSFGTNFAQSLTSVFSEVAYAYRPAAFDPALVRLLRPSHVILQITQRFLHGHPDLRTTLFETAGDKIAALPGDKRGPVVDHLTQALDGPFAALSRPVLDRLAVLGGQSQG